MPPAGAHTVEVGAAEGHKQYHKQYPRQDKVKETVEYPRRFIKSRSEIKDEIDQYARRHRHWQRPFFQYFNKLVH